MCCHNCKMTRISLVVIECVVCLVLDDLTVASKNIKIAGIYRIFWKSGTIIVIRC